MFSIDRRRFLSNSATLAAVATVPASAFAEPEIVHREAGVKLKLGLNAYATNFGRRVEDEAREGTRSLEKHDLYVLGSGRELMRVLVDGLDRVIKGEVIGGELLDGVSGNSI